MHDHFGIGLRVELVPRRLQRLPQFDVVEYLAVEHRPHIAARIVDGLVAGGQVDDGQAVGPAMGQGMDHAFQRRACRLGCDIRSAETCNSAHR
jgi:hypothetical protein